MGSRCVGELIPTGDRGETPVREKLADNRKEGEITSVGTWRLDSVAARPL